MTSAHPALRLPIGLCVYGIAYSTGFTGRGSPRANLRPLDAPGVLSLAAKLGLSSVELPFGYIDPDEDDAALRNYCAQARDLELRVTSAGLPIEVEPFIRHLELAHKVGIKTVRCVLSGVLCGDRRPIGGLEGWQRHLDEMIRRFQAIAPTAETLGIRIGVENHQDATSQDLLYLCESVDSPSVGITLDTGNPLAVAEDPVAFARAVLPHLVHVHLKDYRMMVTPEGYRLFHCAIGAGVVDFATLFALFHTKPGVACHIEMAALGERHIRVLTDDYWAGHAPRTIDQVLPVLRMRERAEGDVEWRTPWEVNQEHLLAQWEMERLVESVANMQAVVTGQPIDY